MHESRQACARDAETVAQFILLHAHQISGKRTLQGVRHPAFAIGAASPGLARIAAHRVRNVPELALYALAKWSVGASCQLLTSVPKPQELLAMQARGIRCVSLVGADAAIAPHASPLAFAIHDLCHLGHFFDEAYYFEQVGCFDAIHRLFANPTWDCIQSSFDESWRVRRDYISADTNGSAIYILSMLKLHLQAAIDRACDDAQLQAQQWQQMHQLIVEAVAAGDKVVAAAFSRVRGRRDAAAEAQLVREHLAKKGRAIVDAHALL